MTDQGTAITDKALHKILKSMADPTRYRMDEEIAEPGELTCSQVAEHFDVSQPTISHHMKVLSEAGILLQRQEGKHHFTSVDTRLMGRIAELVRTRLAPSAKRETPKRA